MSFRRYDHVERLGHGDVTGIADGLVHVFPKLDGTNASVWFGGKGICAGSRNRELTLDADNQGFREWVLSDDEKAEALRDLLIANRNWIVYGEWMVPHTLKTYRPETWRRFWIFDVFDTKRGCYFHWAAYGLALSGMGLDVIEPLCTIDFPSEGQLRAQVEANTYLIADGAGVGEGVVIKCYSWKNRHGRQPWAKIVRNCFKEAASREHGTTHKHGPFIVELAIAEAFCTPELVGKTRAKVMIDVANALGTDLMLPGVYQRIEAENRHRIIPQLLGRVFHDLVTEEIWAILKKHKNAAIDFGLLQRYTNAKVKEYAGDLF